MLLLIEEGHLYQHKEHTVHRTLFTHTYTHN